MRGFGLAASAGIPRLLSRRVGLFYVVGLFCVVGLLGLGGVRVGVRLVCVVGRFHGDNFAPAAGAAGAASGGRGVVGARLGLHLVFGFGLDVGVVFGVRGVGGVVRVRVHALGVCGLTGGAAAATAASPAWGRVAVVAAGVLRVGLGVRGLVLLCVVFNVWLGCGVLPVLPVLAVLGFWGRAAATAAPAARASTAGGGLVVVCFGRGRRFVVVGFGFGGGRAGLRGLGSVGITAAPPPASSPASARLLVVRVVRGGLAVCGVFGVCVCVAVCVFVAVCVACVIA